MRFSPLSLLVIVGPSPIGLKDGLCGKLMEGLPQEFGTGQTPVNPNALSAFLRYRRDARELLHVGRAFESVAIGAERRQQTRRQRGTRSRKTAEQGRVVMLIKQRCDLLIIAFDGIGQGRDRHDERVNHHRRSQQNRIIFGEWLSILDIRDQLLELVLAPISLSLIKLANRGRSRLFQILQRGPALKKSASSSRVQVTKPVQSLRKILLQRRRQLIRQCGAFLDQATPALGQQLNTACQHIIGNPDAQMLTVRHQDLQQQVGVCGIILRAAGIKRLAHFSRSLRIDRIDVYELDVHQRVDQSPAGLLDSDRDRFSAETIPQQLNPTLQSLRRVVQGEPMPLVTTSLLQREDMLLIRPIQAYKCGDFDILFRHLQISPIVSPIKNLPEGSAHNPYSRVLEGQHLSICPAPRADRVRKSPSTVDTVGWPIRNATQPVFHKGNSLQKEKRTKKEKGLWKNAAAMEIREQIGGLRQLFLDADSHSCLEKPRQSARLSHIYHRPDGRYAI